MSTDVLDYFKSLVLLYRYEIGNNVYCFILYLYHCVSLPNQKRCNNDRINKYTQWSDFTIHYKNIQGFTVYIDYSKTHMTLLLNIDYCVY
jgi:hypothetical protein